MSDRALILASGSPRRHELIARLGLPVVIDVSDVPEDVEPGTPPEEMVRALALRKARAVGGRRPSGVILGADTTVALDDLILNKPASIEEATAMLTLLRGRPHTVWTGIALLDATTGRSKVSAVASRVWMRQYSDAEIAAYVATGEPLDKAGAYAIQGGAGVFVERIEGCYANVVGLPLCETVRLLAGFGLTSAAARPICRRPNGAGCPRETTR